MAYFDLVESGNVKTIVLNVGDDFHIPVGMRHQMIALEDSELIEFSMHHEDSDSFKVVKGD